MVASVALVVALAVGQFTVASFAEAVGGSTGALLAAFVFGWNYRRKRWFHVLVAFIAAAHGLALAFIPWPRQHYITKLDSLLFGVDLVAVLALVAFVAWLHGERDGTPAEASLPRTGVTATNSLQGSPSAGLATIDPTSADSSAQRRTRLATRYVTAGIVVMVTTIMLIQFQFDNTTAVTPDHSAAIVDNAMAAAVLTAVATFALTFRIRFRKDTPPWLSALLLALPAAIWLGMLVGFVTDRTYQYLDFPRSEIVQSVAYLPIERAYRTGNRATDYNVQLVGPFANLDVNAVDYATAFDDADDVDPVGYCLRATIQRAGEAMRIMHSSTRPFPAGSVVKCPALPM